METLNYRNWRTKLTCYGKSCGRSRRHGNLSRLAETRIRKKEEIRASFSPKQYNVYNNARSSISFSLFGCLFFIFYKCFYFILFYFILFSSQLRVKSRKTLNSSVQSGKTFYVLGWMIFHSYLTFFYFQ